MKILVADDHRAFGAMVAAILRASLTRDVVVVQSVEAAVAAFEYGTPDVLITDLRFGSVFGGLELIRAVRNHRRFAVQVMPILVISANADVPTIRRARALGVNDFLGKPISPTLLVQRLLAIAEAAAQTLDLPGEPLQA